jgi:hypothetical protein
MTSQTRRTAEQIATRRLVSHLAPDAMRESAPGYTYDPRDNLIYTVSEDDFWSDLESSGGGDLIETPSAPPRFCAACSSAALAVNTFGPFRHRPEHLTLLGESGFVEFQFQKQLPTGLQGAPPHLDAIAIGGSGTVCIESKFLETLSEKDARFPPAYAAAVEQLAESPWADMYRLLIAEPRHFQRLDAAQLVKHYLGMRHTLTPETTRVLLLYLYWEPEDADRVDAFRAHRAELESFAEAVAGTSVGFVAMSYSALWADWERSCSWPDIAEHVNLLRQRYEFPLQG